MATASTAPQQTHAGTSAQLIDIIDQDDLDGDCFVAGGAGEAEILTNTNIVIFEKSTPAAPVDGAGAPVVFNTAEARDFLMQNTGYLVLNGRQIADAARTAYFRLLAARNGLLSPNFSPQNHHVKYNHARYVDAGTIAAAKAALANVSGHEAAIRAAVPGLWKAAARRYFTDIVCCIAYIFRVRGHHYKDDIKDRYLSLWARCLHDEKDLPHAWQFLATDALHAIMPDVLDEFWVYSAQNAKCAGTLIKRVDSAPAGCAGVLALKKGFEDVLMTFPQIKSRVQAPVQTLEHLVQDLSNNRWAGSINHNFYGVPKLKYNESDIGVLASVVVGVYSQLAATSKLLGSPALLRLAEMAPATGGALGVMAKRTVGHESMLLFEVP